MKHEVMIDLIILDLYGTIAIASEYDNHPRNGLYGFLKRNSDKRIVLATDDPLEEAVTAILEEQKIVGQFERIYTGKHLINIRNYKDKRKNLQGICSDLSISPDRSVFISDGNKDRLDAKRDGVKFIHVPKYIQTNEPFSFTMIDLSKNLPWYSDLRKINR